MRRVYVVQDGDEGMFLCPSPDGDVGYTRWVREAGQFDDEQAALDTADMCCDPGYQIFSFFVERMSCRHH